MWIFVLLACVACAAENKFNPKTLIEVAQCQDKYLTYWINDQLCVCEITHRFATSAIDIHITLGKLLIWTIFCTWELMRIRHKIGRYTCKIFQVTMGISDFIFYSYWRKCSIGYNYLGLGQLLCYFLMTFGLHQHYREAKPNIHES